MYETKLTWGEISRMTDEEIIAGSKAADYAVNTEYKFVVYTDATGNNIVNICTIKSKNLYNVYFIPCNVP